MQSLRTHSARTVAAILKGIHLFSDDVGTFANATCEELGCLQQGGSYFVKPCQGKMLTGKSLHYMPLPGLMRQQIDHTAKTLQLGHGTKRRIQYYGT